MAQSCLDIEVAAVLLCTSSDAHTTAGCEAEERGRRSTLMESMWPEDLLVRVARLEEQAGACRFNDDVYPHGASWGFGSCTTCTCKVKSSHSPQKLQKFVW